MKAYLDSILEKVPNNIRQTSPEFISEHIAVFEAKEYVSGQKVNLDHYHFVIFNSAHPSLKIGKKEYQFRKGSLVSLEPEMELEVLPFAGRVKGEYSTISISKDFLRKIAVENFDINRIEFRSMESSYDPHLNEIIDSFKYEIANYGEAYPSMRNIIGTQIAFQILRDVSAGITLHKMRKPNDDKYMKKALEYMQSNYYNNITIEEIAEEIYVSPAHFVRMFREHTGQTPHQYFIGIRVHRAKELLKRNDIPIEQVASLCGFASISHFSTVFKRVTGMKPSAYRRNFY